MRYLIQWPPYHVNHILVNPTFVDKMRPSDWLLLIPSSQGNTLLFTFIVMRWDDGKYNVCVYVIMVSSQFISDDRTVLTRPMDNGRVAIVTNIFWKRRVLCKFRHLTFTLYSWTPPITAKTQPTTEMCWYCTGLKG